MFIPLRTDLPQRSTPYVNTTIIVVTIALYILQVASPAVQERFFVYQPTDPVAWKLVTSAFGHASLTHVGFNMLFLWIFGNAVNDKLGNLAYAGFYLGAAAFASLAHGFFAPNGVLGASGAVAGVSAMFTILAPRARITVVYFFFLIGMLEVPALWFVGLYALLDLLYLGSNSGTAHMAHLGGAAYGVVVGITLLGLHLVRRDQYDALAILHHRNRRRQFRSMAGKGYDAFGADQRLKNEREPETPDAVHDLRATINDALDADDPDRALTAYAELRRADDRQVLSAKQQVEVATLLRASGRGSEAAEAYELFLSHYPRHEQADEVSLLLGLLLARDLDRPGDAEPHLERAAERLRDPEAAGMARQVLGETRAGGVGA